MSDAVLTTVAILRTSDGGCYAVFKENLSARSEYFDALFNGPLSDASRGDFFIPGVSKEALQAIATYASVGDVATTADNVEDLTVAADQLLVDGMLIECCAFISRNVDLDDCVLLLEMAHFFYLESLHKQALRFVLDDFERAYSDNGDFRRLSFQSLESLLALHDLRVRKEEVIREATVFWIKASPKERRMCLGKLLLHARLCLMKGSYSEKVVMRNPLVSENLLCKTIDKRCRIIQQSEHDAYLLNLSRSLFGHRVPADIMFVYVGIHRGYKRTTWEIYDHKTNEWDPVQTDIGQDLALGLQCVSVGCRIYGTGADAASLCPFCCSFDPVSVKWLSTTPMKQLRVFFDMIVLDHCVCCVGGSPDGIVTMDMAEEYDTVTYSWRTVGRMNHPGLGAIAVSCAGRVYTVGGMSTEKLLRSAEACDPVTDKWTVVAPMKAERLFDGLVAYRGKLYVVGGLSCKSSVSEVHYPKSGKWSKGSETKAFTDVAVVMDDNIYAIGEANQKGYKRCLEYFSGDDRKWHAIPGYAAPPWLYSACVFRNLPNAKDYSKLNGPHEFEVCLHYMLWKISLLRK